MICGDRNCDETATYALTWGCFNLHIKDDVTCTTHLSAWLTALPMNNCADCYHPIEDCIYGLLPEHI